MIIEKKENTVSGLNILLFIWACLWAINFIGLGTRIALFGGIFLIIAMLVRNRSLSISYIIILYIIIVFGTIYSITLNFYEDLNFFRGYRELFIPPILYTIGFLSVKKENTLDINIALYRQLMIIISISLFTYASLNIIFHLDLYGDISMYNREVYDIWTGAFFATTSQGSRLLLVASFLVPLILARDIFSKPLKIVLLICIISSFVSTLIMANRSLIVIVLITFIISSLLYFKLNSNNLKNILKILITIIIVILIGFFVYSFDLFGVKSFYESSTFNERIQNVNSDGLLDNSRIDAWLKTISGLYQYPMGGGKSSIGLVYAHNLWLDVAHLTGILPLVILLLITAIYIYYLFKIIKSQEIESSMKLYFFSMSFALMLNLLIEPVFEGHYHLYMVFIFQFGFMHGLVIKKLGKN